MTDEVERTDKHKILRFAQNCSVKQTCQWHWVPMQNQMVLHGRGAAAERVQFHRKVK